MRVQNSELVIPPYINLLNVIRDQRYIDFENSLIKKHVFDLIVNFVLDAYNRIPIEIEQQFIHTLLLILDDDDIVFADKSFFFVLLVFNLKQYVKKVEFVKIS
jgi:hypothetical protein